MPTPDPPAGLSEVLIHDWNEIFISALAPAITTTSLPALRRLFEYRQQWQELKDTWDNLDEDERHIEAQDRRAARVHPAFDRMTKLEPIIDRLEKAMGLQPKAAADLGYVAAATQATWQHVQAGGSPSGELNPVPSELPVHVVEVESKADLNPQED